MCMDVRILLVAQEKKQKGNGPTATPTYNGKRPNIFKEKVNLFILINNNNNNN